MAYFKWDQKTITDFSDENIDSLYETGFVFGRIDKGVMDQTRSVRIDLSKFELSSENRRVLRKTENVAMSTSPIPFTNYDWSIGKLGKDFYDTKFGEKTFSANKIKEILTDGNKTNFNLLLTYTSEGKVTGYCITKQTGKLLHYCYPFYDLNANIPNLGLGMMLKAITWAKENAKKYVYLGSAQRPSDTYKLQFEGLEWFDGKAWKTNNDELKKMIQAL